MYQKTEVYSCDRCGIPGVRKDFHMFVARLTHAEKASMREEFERMATEMAAALPTFMRGMGLTPPVQLPDGVNLLFCGECIRTMMPDLALWRKRSLESYLQQRKEAREDAEVSVED